MLKKLIKHELKNSVKSFLIIYGAIIFFGISLGIAKITENGSFFSSVIILLVLTFITVVTLILRNIFYSYSKKIFSRQGYLTFTLPVSYSKIIFSKIISMLILIVSAYIVSYFALFITTLFPTPHVHQDVFLEGTLLEFIAFLLSIVTLIISFTCYSLVYFAIQSLVVSGGKSKRKKELQAGFYIVLFIYAFSLLTTIFKLIPYGIVVDSTIYVGRLYFGEFAILDFNTVFWCVVSSVGAYFLFKNQMERKLEIEN